MWKLNCMCYAVGMGMGMEMGMQMKRMLATCCCVNFVLNTLALCFVISGDGKQTWPQNHHDWRVQSSVHIKTVQCTLVHTMHYTFIDTVDKRVLVKATG